MIIKFRNIYLTFVVFLALTLFAGAFLPQSHQVSASDSVTVGAKRYKLQNGLTVILKENPASKVCSVQVWVRTGSANETEKEAGITHLIEHMIFKGTSEAAGGEINAYTSYDRTVYYVEIASSHLDIALDVLLDAVQHSVFDPVELEKEKEVVLEEYRRGLDSPSRELGKAVMRLCFKKHPYRRPIIGYEKTIQSFDRNAILAYLDKWYTPQNMVIVVVGDFEAQRVLNLIKALTRDFPRRKWAIAKRPAEPPQRKYRQEIIRRDVRQAYVDISWHIPALSHPDTAALDVMEIILGHGKSS
ncbi:MAG: insulinase family protein, partial [Deltaproteobacteria bacterium]|nr:insulinase family protein [Deltaproteobacteria bacterium]